MDHLRRLTRLLLALVLLAVPSARAAFLFGLMGNPNLSVSGFGWFADIYLERSLHILDNDDEPRTRFDGVYLEDAVWILAGEIQQKGYLSPVVHVTLSEGETVVFDGAWRDGDMEPNTPREVSGDAVVFTIEAGRLYYFNQITVDGLPAGFTSNPASYFYATDQLIVSEGDRYFTDGRVSAGLSRLLLALRAAGYHDAKVVSHSYESDAETGAVDVQAVISPGAIYWVRRVELRERAAPKASDDGPAASDEPLSGAVADAPAPEAAPLMAVDVDPARPMTPEWVASLVQTHRRNYFRQGYPNVDVDSDFRLDPDVKDRTEGTLIITLEPGEKATVHGVRYEGGENVANWLLDQQAKLKTGEPLDRTRVEEGRAALSRLGLFRRVKIHYEEVEPGQWDVVYQLEQKSETQVDLIFGVGSFDIIRGGFNLERRNLWGIGHRANLKFVQSFRATYADLGYQIPQIFGEDVDFFSSFNYVRREELTFLRQEWGGDAGLQHYFPSIDVSGSLSYSLGTVKASQQDFLISPGPLQARIGAVDLKFVQSDLDNPVFPTDGYHWFLTMSFARPDFGGNVDYNRFEVGGAWHHPLGDFGLTLHLGFKHGVIITDGEASQEIPVNRRFFQGGENTVRGYQRDQASPVNAFGQQIGAVSTMLWQGELEQRLNETFSIVAFVDAVGNAADISDYPFNETLVSVGGGVSIHTIVGPLRFEYGYNVKKRPIDPDGTFQVGLGFPF